MSLIQTYHNKDFGVICSDGRVSQLLPDGRRAAKPKETAIKFVVLRASPGLVLAGSSTVSQWLDLTVYRDVHRYVEKFPEASLDQVAGIIAPTVHTAALSYAKEVGKLRRKIFRLLVVILRAPFASPKIFGTGDRVNLNLLGYDRAKMRVRNRVFSCTAHSPEQWERDDGVTISGDVSTEEGDFFGDKLLELIGNEYTPKSVAEAMLSIAAEISALRPETIGPPYSFVVVTRADCTRLTVTEHKSKPLQHKKPSAAIHH
jgi:hypothetical protein